jgi:hypothetical protein
MNERTQDELPEPEPIGMESITEGQGLTHRGRPDRSMKWN